MALDRGNSRINSPIPDTLPVVAAKVTVKVKAAVTVKAAATVIVHNRVCLHHPPTVKVIAATALP